MLATTYNETNTWPRDYMYYSLWCGSDYGWSNLMGVTLWHSIWLVSCSDTYWTRCHVLTYTLDQVSHSSKLIVWVWVTWENHFWLLSLCILLIDIGRLFAALKWWLNYAFQIFVLILLEFHVYIFLTRVDAWSY